MDNNQNFEHKSINDLLKSDTQNNNKPNITDGSSSKNETQHHQKDKTLLSTIIFIFLCIVVISYGIYFTFFRTKVGDNKEEETIYIEEAQIKIDKEILLGWNGVYTFNNNQVVIYMYDDYNINIDMNIRNTTYGFFATHENVTENKITYEREEFGNTVSITLEKTNEGIVVTSSSSDKKDTLNVASGTYTKNSFKDYGWTNTYVKDDTTIILNEIDKDYVVCQIIKDSYISTFNFDTVDKNKLYFYDEADKGSITITKTDDDITVEAQSNRDGDIFNEIDGIYKKS